MSRGKDSHLRMHAENGTLAVEGELVAKAILKGIIRVQRVGAAARAAADACPRLLRQAARVRTAGKAVGRGAQVGQAFFKH